MKQSNTRQMTYLALLIALQIILSVTPLGFLPLGIFSVTIMHIPVLIGAITLGTKAGAILGTVFGLSSIFVATFRAPTPADIIFTPFLSGSLWSLVLALAPRILCGIFAAWVYRAIGRRTDKVTLGAAIAAAVGSLTNTVLVLGSIYLFFGKIYSELIGVAHHTLLGLFLTAAGTNGVIEMIAAALICSALTKPLLRITRS